MSDNYNDLVGKEWLQIKEGNFWRAYSNALDLLRKNAVRVCELASSDIESIRVKQGVIDACDQISRIPDKITKPPETAGKK